METFKLAGDTRLLVRIDDARELLGGISRSYLYELLSSGALPSVKLGKRRLIPIGDLEAFAAALPSASDHVAA